MPRMAIPSLARGDLLGRYVVLERLGVGGMGEVFAAYDPQLDRKIAVKLLLPSSAGMHASRLLREAQAMAKLRHPNVVTVHDVGTYDERVFVAMEFVDGGTLADWMHAGSDERATPHPWRQVLERFDAAGRGLAAAHAAKLVHRDFKPANVLLSTDGQVRVADFGLVRRTLDEHETTSEELPRPSIAASPLVVDDDATLAPELAIGDEVTLAGTSSLPSASASASAPAHDSLSERMTLTGATLGTPAYMAPEQYAGRHVDARADQFSFCVALWEALYGRRPFHGENLHTLMFAIEQGRFDEPANERDVPRVIHKAIARGLARDPAARWPDMDALLAALRVDPEQVRRRRRNLVLGLACGGLALLALTQREPAQPAAPPPPPCTGAAAALGDALSPARRSTLADHFAAFEQAWARDMGERVLPQLDEWTTRWQQGWTDACEDTRVRGEQSEELLDRRMLCLDRERRRFVDLVDALSVADPALAKKADLVLDELGALDSCADAEALLRVTPLPDDPPQVDAILRIEQDIDDATVHYLAGEYADALALLEPHRTSLAALDYAPLVAAFEHIDGRIGLELDDAVEGERSLEHAFVTALAAGDDALAIEVARSLATALNDLDRAKEALRWLDIATGLARRNDDASALANLALTRSQSLANLGEYAAAETAARDAFDGFVANESSSSKIGDALYLLGTADYRAGRLDAAITHVEQARQAWARSIGPNHPRNSSALSLLGIAARGLGRYDEAEQYLEQVLAIKLATYGPESRDVATAMMNLAVVLGDQGKTAAAIEQLERVVELRRTLPDASNGELGRALVNLAQMYRNADQLDAANLALREGESLLAALGDDHPDRITLLLLRADLELELGNPANARRAASEAKRVADLKAAGTPYLVEIYTIVAKAELGAGDAREAKRLLDQVSAIELDDALTRARRDSVLAQTLVALGDVDQGMSLARATKTAFEALGLTGEHDRAALERWLAGQD
jgi:serine/threonine protein kinase/tetratricopeptide (TPR) repeat protein